MDADMWLNVFIAFGSLIFTLVGCTAAIIIFLWKKFDAVYTQIEEIKIAQGEKYVKHTVCEKRMADFWSRIEHEFEIQRQKTRTKVD